MCNGSTAREILVLLEDVRGSCVFGSSEKEDNTVHVSACVLKFKLQLQKGRGAVRTHSQDPFLFTNPLLIPVLEAGG